MVATALGSHLMVSCMLITECQWSGLSIAQQISSTGSNNSDTDEFGPPYTQIPRSEDIDDSETSTSGLSLSHRSISFGVEYTPRTKRRMKAYGANIAHSLNIPTSLMLPFTDVSYT